MFIKPESVLDAKFELQFDACNVASDDSFVSYCD